MESVVRSDDVRTEPSEQAASRPGVPVIERNSVVHLGLFAAGVGLSVVTRSPLGLCLHPLALLLNEVVDLAWGRSLFSHTICVRRAYQWFDTFLDRPADGERDLSEGLFDGDEEKSVAQAVGDKYDYVLAKLGLRRGDRLLDIGCGYGQFITWARKKGIRARGLTISPEQAASGRARGLDVICADGRDPPADLDGQFDAVTYLGCLEHFSQIQHWHRQEEQDAVYLRVFETAHRLLDPRSSVRTVFTSALHRTTTRYQARDFVLAYFVLRHYGGLYPRDPDGIARHAAPRFEVLETTDRTRDYQVTSLKDERHFGQFSVRWTFRRILCAIGFFLVDPYALHKWGYHLFGAWMWQFGRLDSKEQSPPTRLRWSLFRAAPAEAERGSAPAEHRSHS